MKHLDAERLKAEIERRLERYDPDYTNAGSELKEILSFITSLQQEQPDGDLEKEIDDWYNTMGVPVLADALKETARHFYELGRARKEE